MVKMNNKDKSTEFQDIATLFKQLLKQPEHNFPEPNHSLNAPSNHGVYIIRKKEKILHVGRSVRGKGGLRQRLKNHLHGSSSFTAEYLKGEGRRLRDRTYTYQYLEVPNPRKRALLEAYAIGKLCPEHIGLGVES